MKYQSVIGLEVHVELNTKSKMFCGCSADYFGKEPNTYVCPVCLGLPGALPVPNKKAIEWCVIIGIALGCKIPNFSKFDRKNYFYPDLPKGYQISQYDQPFCLDGAIILSNGKKIGITRAHMEEDTAKLTHQYEGQGARTKGQGYSLIDFNRSGVPLVEIVTEPDFETAEEVVEYLKKLQQLVRYLGVSNADMEKGDMRLEPNISLREINGERLGRQGNDQALPPYKVEVKNINSFKFVARAINFEIKRQAEILDRGKIPSQETRGWNEAKDGTVSQRSKEEAHDYRYFPEPDIPPIVWEKEQLAKLKEQIPELPWEKGDRFIGEYGLKETDAKILSEDTALADIFEEVVKLGKKGGVLPKQVGNFVINQKVDLLNVSPAQIIDNIKAKKANIIQDELELKKVANEVLKENQKSADAYKGGKETAIMALVGAVMRKTRGKADPKIARTILEELLKK